ncbi:class I SAM-dependent methyltransferase [Carboxylicivirga sediminis]|uniref:Class I SAM-dependent methyltransferase n=1 Tax=Carboxylicivirga sediminis TaxID=2006564 RepID=A0A941F2Q0_9BACT|nr:class I SAM-dependent methyltransferase [Carboxylicivirga sediminis]MBR8535668.1 class I SAM-dependent methyltransferase [Carboxylicivirga sediminis]
MTNISIDLEQYILNHIDDENAILQELNRQTHIKMLQPRMLSGHLQGQILKMLCFMINPLNVLEIGTFTGYSAISMALGCRRDGACIDTIEINDENEEFIQTFIDKAGMQHMISLHIGSAIDIIPSLNKKYDLIFMDGDKRQYRQYYKLVFDRLNPGGYILADNVLWDGKVIQDVQSNDTYTQELLAFNQLIKEDDRVEKVILPIRDGITIIRKK